MAAEEILKIVEVAYARLPHSTSRPKLLDLIGIRSDANVITPRRKNLIARSSLPCVRRAIRQSPFPVYEDAS